MNRINTVIFDFGGVLLDLDLSLTTKGFEALGIPEWKNLYQQQKQADFLDLFEKGLISEMEFFERIKEISKKKLSDARIKNAWNAMLIDLPEHKTRLLEELKTKKKLFLLSNTNSIHEKKFTEIIDDGYGTKNFYALFTKVYFSHRMKMRKPDVEIFLKVLEENSLIPQETLFLDDSPQHISGARKAGINAELIDAENTPEMVVRNYF